MKVEEIKEIVASALEVSAADVGDDASSETLEAWDSLGHISILVALDAALDGRVAAIDGMKKAYSVRAIADLLRGHGLLD